LNEVTLKIIREVEKHGTITFAEFMRHALYCPVYGYYEKEKDMVGRSGDFYTSVSVGSLFGELLAFRFASWLAEISTRADARFGKGARPDDPAQIVESGAHRGQLARDILAWTRQYRPGLFECLEYVIVEPSTVHQTAQKDYLDAFASKIRWVQEMDQLVSDEEGPKRIIFSNELLDAMPVHKVAWDAQKKTWFEWGVGLNGNAFCWQRIEPPECSFPKTLNKDSKAALEDASFLESLPDGYSIEFSSAARQWWTSAARALGSGKLLTFDYGFESHELFAPERRGGTLRAYQYHRVQPDVLHAPGESDITAHVNFPALQEAGESVGLTTECFMTQERFLTQIAGLAIQTPDGFGEWNSSRTRQLQTLTHPNHLGRSFKVLIQTRGV
jgi:SAM-dependent MidA family methyltransferase